MIDDLEPLEWLTCMCMLTICGTLRRAFMSNRDYTPAERQLPAQASASSYAVRVDGILLLVSERDIEVIYG